MNDPEWKTVYHSKQTEEQKGSITKSYETITRTVMGAGECPPTLISNPYDAHKTTPIKIRQTLLDNENSTRQGTRDINFTTITTCRPFTGEKDEGFFEKLIADAAMKFKGTGPGFETSFTSTSFNDEMGQDAAKADCEKGPSKSPEDAMQFKGARPGFEMSFASASFTDEAGKECSGKDAKKAGSKKVPSKSPPDVRKFTEAGQGIETRFASTSFNEEIEKDCSAKGNENEVCTKKNFQEKSSLKTSYECFDKSGNAKSKEELILGKCEAEIGDPVKGTLKKYRVESYEETSFPKGSDKSAVEVRLRDEERSPLPANEAEKLGRKNTGKGSLRSSIQEYFEKRFAAPGTKDIPEKANLTEKYENADNNKDQTISYYERKSLNTNIEKNTTTKPKNEAAQDTQGKQENFKEKEEKKHFTRPYFDTSYLKTSIQKGFKNSSSSSKNEKERTESVDPKTPHASNESLEDSTNIESDIERESAERKIQKNDAKLMFEQAKNDQKPPRETIIKINMWKNSDETTSDKQHTQKHVTDDTKESKAGLKDVKTNAEDRSDKTHYATKNIKSFLTNTFKEMRQIPRRFTQTAEIDLVENNMTISSEDASKLNTAKENNQVKLVDEKEKMTEEIIEKRGNDSDLRMQYKELRKIQNTEEGSAVSETQQTHFKREENSLNYRYLSKEPIKKFDVVDSKTAGKSSDQARSPVSEPSIASGSNRESVEQADEPMYAKNTYKDWRAFKDKVFKEFEDVIRKDSRIDSGTKEYLSTQEKKNSNYHEVREFLNRERDDDVLPEPAAIEGKPANLKLKLDPVKSGGISNATPMSNALNKENDQRMITKAKSDAQTRDSYFKEYSETPYAEVTTLTTNNTNSGESYEGILKSGWKPKSEDECKEQHMENESPQKSLLTTHISHNMNNASSSVTAGQKLPKNRNRGRKDHKLLSTDWAACKQYFLDESVQQCKQKEKQMKGNLRDIHEIVADVRKLSEKMPKSLREQGDVSKPRLTNETFKKSVSKNTELRPLDNVDSRIGDVTYITEVTFHITPGVSKLSRPTAL